MKKPEGGQPSEIPPFPDFAGHERRQVLFNLRHTTPLQRLKWLEETIHLLAPYLHQKRP